MSEKRLDYDLLWNNYYQVIELDDGDTDYLRRLSPTEIIKRLNEQQATIRRLQDLCGESDSGNAKLRIENKKLKEENEQLRNELTFLNKVISFFADNPMTKYSSKSELLEEMKLLEEMGLI